MKKFKVIIRDCSCDEEDKTCRFTKYVLATSMKAVCVQLDLSPFEWVDKIEELEEFPKNVEVTKLMETRNIIIEKGNSMTCRNADGYLTGSIAAIKNDIIVQIDIVTENYKIVQFRGADAYIQINCESYEVKKITE